MAGLFSPATLEQIRAASDIADIVGAVVPLKKSGSGFVARCPFHKEKTPSFHVNSHRQIFHCFGCHKGGDVFRFVQDYENISFPEAVRRLAERARIPLEFEADDGTRQRRSIKESLLQLHEAVAQHWQAILANAAAGQTARDYLARRGVAPDAIRLFRLGAAPDAWDDTVNWARSKGYDLTLVEQAGLVLRKEGSDHFYDRFRGRLLFPIADEQGRVIAFSGRVLAGDEKTAKYVNSPETPIFSKGRVFYGLDKSKRILLDAGFAVVCEGQLDLIACFTAGVQNVVAPQGTALTADHARILRRYVEEVVLCFDSDAAGQNAALRSLDDLLASGLAIRVVAIPSPHDPDSYIKQFGAAAFQQLIDNAQGFFDFLLDRLIHQHDPATDRGRLAIVRAMGEAVAKAGSAVLFDTYAQKTAQCLRVTPEAIRTEFRQLARRKGPETATLYDAKEVSLTTGADAPAPVRPSPQEFWLLKLLLLEDAERGWTRANLDQAWIQHPGVRRMVGALLDLPPEAVPDVAALIGGLEDEHDRSLASEAVSDRRTVPNQTQQIVDLVRRLRDQKADRDLAALTQDLAREDLSEEARHACLKRQQLLRELKRQPLPSPRAIPAASSSVNATEVDQDRGRANQG